MACMAPVPANHRAARTAGPVRQRSLTQALRQLELYGRDGLPVLADDGQHVQGWITSHNVLQAIARQISAARATANQAPRTRRQDPSGPQDVPARHRTR